MDIEGKTCHYGTTYEEFPDATRSDDIFLGWYTQKGELITENTIVIHQEITPCMLIGKVKM